MKLSLFQLPWTAKDLLILEQTLTCTVLETIDKRSNTVQFSST